MPIGNYWLRISFPIVLIPLDAYAPGKESYVDEEVILDDVSIIFPLNRSRNDDLFQGLEEMSGRSSAQRKSIDRTMSSPFTGRFTHFSSGTIRCLPFWDSVEYVDCSIILDILEDFRFC